MSYLALSLLLLIHDRPRLDDLEFEGAVERSVMAEFGTHPPEPYRSAIEGMGAYHYLDREAASREMFARCQLGGRRWIWWAHASPDPEIRLRATTIVRRLSPCSSCRGTGASRHHRGRYCSDCYGVGSVWWWGAVY